MFHSATALCGRRNGRPRQGRGPTSLRGGATVADFISELAARTGVSPDLAGKGVGAVLAVLKDKLPAGVFAQVQSAVPNADGLMAAAESSQGASGGGILGAVSGAVGKLVG